MQQNYLTIEQKNQIKEIINPKGSNYKDCNFFRVIEKTEQGTRIEIGYWITRIGCRPIYQKEIRFFNKL